MIERPKGITPVDPLIYAQRLSYKKKAANDFEWAKQSADAFDYQGMVRQSKDMTRRKENYQLWNGFGVDSVQQTNYDNVSSSLKEEELGGAYTKVQHYDVISQIGHGMHGEQIARPLTVTVKDSSQFSQSERRTAEHGLLQQYLQQKFIAPAQQQAMQQVMQQNGITDPFSIPPEQQQQLQQAVDQMTEAMTPKDIKKYMSKDFKSIREIQANKLVQNLIMDLDIKYLTDYNFQNVIIDGREIYYVGIRGGKPVLEIINPLKFRYHGSDKNIFIQDAEWAIYEDYITIGEVYNRYGDVLTKEDLKKLDTITNFGGPGGNKLQDFTDYAQSTILGGADFNKYRQEIAGINPRTAEGQRRLVDIDSKYVGKTAGYNMVREAHITWRAQRRLKVITRILEDGSTDKFFVDESYKFNPLRGDIEQADIWVNEIWETVKLGYLDAIYINTRPVPYQYRSLKNPRDVKLPYIGAEYFKMMGNSDNTSPLEKGKSWNYDINLQMAKIRELESTDLGKVLLMTMAAKPDNWSWGKFFQVIRYTKMAPLDLKKEGVDSFDAQFFKSLDLSNMQDIAAKIQYLEWLINRAAISMSFNAARMGQTQQYATAQNNQQNLARSLSQTASIYSMHDKIVRQVLEALLNASRIAYKDNKEYFANILDDGQMAELELDPELLWSSEMGVHITSSAEDLDNINLIKQNLMNFVQNGLGLPDAIRVLWSKSGAELFNTAQEIEEKQMIQQQQQMQQMQDVEASQAQLQQDMARLQAELKMVMQDKDLAAKMEMAAIGAETMRNAGDVNRNNESDYIELELLKGERDMQKFEQQTTFDKEKFLMEMELRKEELKVKAQQAKAKSTKKK